jgi:dihydroorotate dehydrogenase (fumarate)
MKDLSSKYLGLTLKTPFIVASSGISKSIDNLKLAEKNGAGAIVVKSLFEEQISYEVEKTIKESNDYPEAADYIKNYSRHHSLNEYLEHIKLLKRELSIPVIASINCSSNDEWTKFAKDIEKAGADGLELNMNIPTLDITTPSSQIEEQYYKIVENIKKSTNLKISAKLGKSFTNLPYFIKQLKNRGVDSFVLFNKYFEPIINTDTMKMVGSAAFSSTKDIKNSLRSIAIVKGLIEDIDISASTGIFDYDGVAQYILAGASSVQLCSVLYKNGVKEISIIKKEFEEWMDKNGFNSLEDFKSKLCYKNVENPYLYERYQFMKHISSVE